MVALREIMTATVHTTTSDATVGDAASTMVAARVGSALVMTGSVLVGIITERDVLRAAASGRDLTSDPVRNWMTPDPITATPDEDVDQSTQTMVANGFRHLPVLDGSEVVGIVSLRDLLSAHIRGRG